MKSFDYFQPTEIHFGVGRVEELGKTASRFGQRCLLVTTPANDILAPMYDRVKKILTDAGVIVSHFDQIQPNPTTDNITAGAENAKIHKAEMIIGLGGGSAMDAAKAIAVEATHDGSSWEYLFYRDKQPTEKTLPIIAVSTTSGTGSQVTQVAVVTHTKARDKSALYNSILFPDVCIVDPELMVTVPKHITACTGFDAFCHAFESVIHPNTSAYGEVLAWEAIQTVVDHLPAVLENPDHIEARSRLAYADTLAGLCIANAGVTLPHGVGMAISGLYPHIAHGEALAMIYPPFTRFTSASAISQFARIGQILNPELLNVTDEVAAEGACQAVVRFLEKIGMKMTLKDAGMPEEEIPALVKQSMVLPDYQGNPRVATDAEMVELIKQAYFGT